MEFIIDGKTVSIKDMTYLNGGSEGEVYRYQDKAVKIYKPISTKQRLKYEDAEKMTTIHTEYVLLPKGMVHNIRFSPKGYYTMYKEGQPRELLLTKSTREFADDLDEVYGDLKTLASYRITVDDLCFDNFVYDGHIRFVDPGSYMFEDIPPEVAYLINKEMFSEFVIEDLFRRVISLSKKDVQILKRHYLSDTYLSDMIRSEGRDEEPVKRYVKRIIRDEKKLIIGW